MENDERRRKREREVEKDEADKAEDLKRKMASDSHVGGLPTEKIDEFLHRADTLIDQLNNLYNMYISGAERLAPIEKRKQLDQLMATLTYTAKPTPAILFKCNSMISRFNTHKDRWDRLARDLESGKIKRQVGPNRG